MKQLSRALNSMGCISMGASKKKSKLHHVPLSCCKTGELPKQIYADFANATYTELHSKDFTQFSIVQLTKGDNENTLCVADLRGAHTIMSAPGIQILSISCSFQKNWQNCMLVPPPPLGSWCSFLREILDPPLVFVARWINPG